MPLTGLVVRPLPKQHPFPKIDYVCIDGVKYKMVGRMNVKFSIHWGTPRVNTVTQHAARVNLLNAIFAAHSSQILSLSSEIYIIAKSHHNVKSLNRLALSG